MTNPNEHTTDLLRTVLTDLSKVVDGIDADQNHQPTPCTDLDVAQLRNHTLGWLTMFAAGFDDPNGQAPQADLAGYQAPADAAGEVRAAADRLDRALRNGAAERPLRLGESAMPGDLALGMILCEYQVHGWDIAVATGQPWSPPAEAAEESLAFMPNMLTEDYQGVGKPFAPRVDVPADAAAFDRLLGLVGRDPHWSA